MKKPNKLRPALNNVFIEWYEKVFSPRFYDPLFRWTESNLEYTFSELTTDYWEIFVNYLRERSDEFDEAHKMAVASTPNSVQYYYVAYNVRKYQEGEGYENDGWLYRQVGDGPVRIWALFNCESSIPYEQRNGIKKDWGYSDEVFSEYWDYPTKHNEMHPISRKDAEKIMRKWRRLAKQYMET